MEVKCYKSFSDYLQGSNNILAYHKSQFWIQSKIKKQIYLSNILFGVKPTKNGLNKLEKIEFSISKIQIFLKDLSK